MAFTYSYMRYSGYLSTATRKQPQENVFSYSISNEVINVKLGLKGQVTKGYNTN